MKRSRKIALTLIASASIVATGCSSSEQKTQREVYATKEKCVEDWGSDERCEQSPTGSGYVGPHYYRSGTSIFFFSAGSTNPLPLSNTPNAKFANVPAGRTSPNSLGPISTTYKPGSSSYSSTGRTTIGVSSPSGSPQSSHTATSPSSSGATSRGGLGASASSHSSSS